MFIRSWNGKCPLNFCTSLIIKKITNFKTTAGQLESNKKNICLLFRSQKQNGNAFHWKEHCTSLIPSMCSQRKIRLMEWWNPLHSPSVSSGNPLNFPSQINESSSKWLGKRKKEERKKKKKSTCFETCY